MIETMKQYCYFENPEYCSPILFPTREEAALEAFTSDGDLEKVCTAECVTPPRVVSADMLIEDVAVRTTEEAGDWADDYLDGVTKEAEADLQERLQVLWDEWEARWKLEPTWFNVEDIVEHKREDFADQLSDGNCHEPR